MDFRLTTEQHDLVAAATRLANERFAPRAFTWSGFPWENAKVLAGAGFTGITIPADDGGQGGSLLDAVLVMGAISQVCPHSGDAVQATNFGAIRQIAAFGSDRVKREVLPPLLAGEALVSVGMSEPEAGSALTELTTTARYDGDDVVLDGQKVWNSHGPEVTHVVVWCRFGPRTRDIGAVVAPADAPGFAKGPAERYMSGEQHCALYLDGCRVPREYVLADSDALRRMMTIFGVERVGNAVRALALAQAAFDRAVEHARVRKQFGRRLCEFQGIQWKFADMRMRLDAARLLVYRAACNADQTTGGGPAGGRARRAGGRVEYGQGGGKDAVPDPAEVSIAKTYANEAAFEVTNQALQIFGAAGYSTEFPLEYLARRVRGWMIAGGSVEMQRNRIAEAVFGERFSQRAPSEPT